MKHSIIITAIVKPKRPKKKISSKCSSTDENIGRFHFRKKQKSQ